ncbi:MAG: N-6 DNA methylase [Anaerolineae bacterium]|nr:N-6 DNA methylase [Anaerolineae bacterium]
MTVAEIVRPNHKAVKTYYAEMERFAAQDVTHEMAVRSAFQNLLADAARKKQWTLVPEQTVGLNGKTVRPDGTLRDQWQLPHGYWEAKDSADDLDTEIRRKRDSGYPFNNILFEDTRQGVLFQHHSEVLRADLTDPHQLADLLNHFLAYREPVIDDFERAVGEFQEQIPRLAEGLNTRIKTAHQDNPRFKTEFEDFFTLCRETLNPNLSRDAVDEMLIQHLLTERLMRTVFDMPEFVRRNVIAGKVEDVIDALTSQNFNRHEFLGNLDRFYVAIERAAKNLPGFEHKQRFINTVYERFFQGYSIKVADTHGIVYTPQEIVDFMCAAVVETLHTEFGLSLGDDGVTVLDPCTGTGNFIVNLLRRIEPRHLETAYKEQLFANEVMLLPYYIASLNIEHEYRDRTGKYQPFEGLCFVDTLDLAEGRQLPLFAEKNTARVDREKRAPITVIIGNPPYNVGQINENDNNKNRTYDVVDKRIRNTYVKSSQATLKIKYYDPYIRFFRWATDRLNDRDGIVCFVTNNGFVDDNSLDGIRQHLEREFTRIYHIDLHGNVRQNPELSGTTHNVFGIQVGVGITIAVRAKEHQETQIFYHRVPEFWLKEEKLRWLSNALEAPLNIEWTQISANEANTWLLPENEDEFSHFIPIGTKEAKEARSTQQVEVVFRKYSLGVSTNRDSHVYDFSRIRLGERMNDSVEAYNAEVDRFSRQVGLKRSDVDDFVDYEKIKWSYMLKSKLYGRHHAIYSSNHIRECIYRPFARRQLYFDPMFVDAPALQPQFFPLSEKAEENRMIVVSDIGYRAENVSVLMASGFVDLHLCATTDGHQCFPFYVYDEDGSNRRENITDWALARFRAHYGDEAISKWDVFYYVYGLLHHPTYRERYGDNLKRDLPRLPFAPDFRAFAEAGRALARWHLDYESVEPYPLDWVYSEGVPLHFRVEKMRLNRDKTRLTVNDSLALGDIPPEVYQYRLGNRSALEWGIDQYRVKTDSRSGIVSDPNDPANERYIVDLVGRVVRISLETVRIVAGLPELLADDHSA